MSEQITEQTHEFQISVNDFLEIAKSVQIVSEEPTWVITDEGLTCRAMDPSHVSLIDVSFPNSCFETWNITQERKFSVNLREFVKILKRLDVKKSVRCTILEKSIKLSQGGHIVSVELLDESATDAPLPKIPYDSQIVLNGSKTISDFRKDMQGIYEINFSSHVTISCTDERVIFSSKSEKGECEITYDKDECDLSNRQNSISSYSLEYILPFLKVIKNNDLIILEFSQAKPIRIERKITNIGRIHYYVAPRVEN